MTRARGLDQRRTQQTGGAAARSRLSSPDRAHLTVPRGFRKEPPAGCVLHLRELGPADIERREGFAVTRPLRTLVDAALSLDVPHEEVVRAAKSALERGLVSKAALAAALLRE